MSGGGIYPSQQVQKRNTLAASPELAACADGDARRVNGRGGGPGDSGDDAWGLMHCNGIGNIIGLQCVAEGGQVVLLPLEPVADLQLCTGAPDSDAPTAMSAPARKIDVRMLLGLSLKISHSKEELTDCNQPNETDDTKERQIWTEKASGRESRGGGDPTA